MSTTITVHLLEPDGRRHTLAARAGASLMRTATGAGIEGIAADCGGSLICATCHVYVDPAWSTRLQVPSSDETAMLEMTAAPRRATSRLSCQIVLRAALDGLVVELPPNQY
jgi:ferredoxin, 2Fe-2S